MNSKSLNTFLIAAVVLSFAACKKNIGMESYQNHSLSFELAMADTDRDLTYTDAGTKAFEIKSADGSFCLPLEYRVTDGIGEVSQTDEVQTKGRQFNLLSELQEIGTFNITAWSSDGSRFIPEAGDESAYGTVNYNSTSGRWTLDGTAPLWESADIKTFFAYTNLPEGASVTCESDASHTFTYTTLKTDASEQSDALLGYYKGNGDRDGDGTADGVARIQFIHPLTAVVFKKGDFVDVTAIKSLSIEGVYAGGTAEVTYDYTDGNIIPTFNWGGSLSETTTVTQTVPNSGALPDEGEQIGESFILIPQDLSEKKVTIKAVITLSAGGDQLVLAELNTGNWEAGKTNTYTLGYDSQTYSYIFTLLDGETSQSQTFTNTTSQANSSVSIVNKRKSTSGEESYGEWNIKSVQIGSREVEKVNATSFSGKEGISVYQSSTGVNSLLNITVDSRTAVIPGTNDFWRNTESRTMDLDWSPADWSSLGTIDLSEMDYSKDDPAQAIEAHQMTTANCYVIRHAGTYKLPLVYGNAVVNGTTNELSYYPDASGGSNRLERFVNSTGAGIESPYIENATGCGGSDLKCAVVWQDKAEVVKNLQIVNGASASTPGSYTKDNVRYLQFSISQSDICQNNALICVYKDANGNGNYDSGEAIWSWHVWTTNNPALLTGPIAVTNINDVEYEFFPVYNLGWIDATNYPGREDVKIVLVQKKSGNEITLIIKQNSVLGQSNGCWYQFGRKDPMCTTDSPVQGNNTVNAGMGTLAQAICNPGKFYSTTTDWCSIDYHNLWTGKFSSTGLLDQSSDLIKTIYDPSPVGYKMPASNVFTGFTTTGGNSSTQVEFNVDGPFEKGWYFYTKKSESTAKCIHTTPTPIIFFPAAGGRNLNGSINGVGVLGRYWSAIPNSNDNGYCPYITSGDVFPKTGTSRGGGFSVRPVLE